MWHGLVTGIPTAAEIGQPPDAAVCNDGLVLVRSTSGAVQPTPDRAVDQAVREWVGIAEDAFFECPPSSHAVPSFGAAYQELAELEAEVMAALAIDEI